MPSFRTKRGRCHLDGDTLCLESSLRGQFRRLREGSRVLFWTYVLALLSAAGFLVSAGLAGEYWHLGLSVGGALLVIALGYGRNALRGFTRDAEIPLEDVVCVTATAGTKGLTRPRFVVHYERDGERRKRYVTMPSLWLDYGEAEFERAKACFRAQGLTVEH